MANLTITAYWTRKAVKYGAFFLVFLLVARFTWDIGSTYWRKISPPAPPKPTVDFGRLPKLAFPQPENPPEVSYRLETISGNIPTLDTIGKVYFMPRPVANLLALSRTKELAQKIGFTQEPVALSDRLYRFTGQNTATTLEIDIIDLKFTLTYDFTNDQEILTEKKLPGNDQAVAEAKNFLSQAGLLSPDLSEGQAQVSYIRFAAPDLLPAVSLSEADFVKVDLFRQDINELKILTPNPNQALVSFLISGARGSDKRFVKINYFHQLISTENMATYPLKTSSTAWQELQSGQGFVANKGSGEEKQATIRKITLGYYEAGENQNFLQPIFVFEGDNNFTAYVPAVDSQWIEE